MTIVLDPSLGTPSGITLASLIDRVLQNTQQRENLNELAENVSATATELKLAHSLSGIARGTELNIDSETCYVWEPDGTNKTLRVRRAHGGGAPAAPHSAGALVTIGGKSRRQIIDALNDELAVVSASGIFQMKTANVPYNYSNSAFALPELELFSDLYDVQYLITGETVDWARLPGWHYSPTDNAISLPMSRPWTNSVRVLYKAKFKPFVNNEDDIQSDIGLHSEAADILVYGACWRLLVPDEAQRNTIYSQGDSRRPDEVPPGAVRAASLGYKAIRDERIGAEKDRLRRIFPTRKAGW